MKKPKEIKLITFDLDDTLWDNMPTITKAEIDTRKYIEERVGKIEWGDLNDFLNLREELINCLLYTSPSPRDATLSRMPSSA